MTGVALFSLYAPRVPTYHEPPRGRVLVGRRQVVRQRILIPSYGGSNPPAPANACDVGPKPSEGQPPRIFRQSRGIRLFAHYLTG
jgi:hypothetical protein